MVAIRKPGKGDYTLVKSYRPVALLNTIGKALKSILAKRLGYLADIFGLLPKTHFEGRAAMSAEQAIHLLLEKIYSAWQLIAVEPKVASLLLLDVTGAFNFVSHERLLHNLRKRRIDPKVVNWIESFISGRETTLRLDDYTTEPFIINTGIPQGSPLSPIIYLFYNADLLEACSEPSTYSTSIGYIDDMAILAIEDTAEENCQTLAAIHERAKTWAFKHAFIFAEDKYELIHFMRSHTP